MKKIVLIALTVSSLLAFGILPLIALDAPVAHWKLDEGQGNSITDASGNGHDGELVGNANWVNGQIDKALEFDGANNEVVVSDDDALDGMSQLTIAAWVNSFGQGDSVYPRILSKGHEHSWTFLIDANAGNRLRFVATITNGKLDITGTTDLTPMFNQYHHYAVVWDGAEVVFYINGVETHRAAAAGDAVVNTDEPVRIGNSPSGRHFQGIIDDVWLFNKALSVADVGAVMSGNATAVSSAGKLAVKWGVLKMAF